LRFFLYKPFRFPLAWRLRLTDCPKFSIRLQFVIPSFSALKVAGLREDAEEA
jgi:hypothetical protein